jgi:hypothetical protein
VRLNAEAAALISKQVGKHQTHVFSFRDTPIRQVSTKTWHQALERAGVLDFRMRIAGAPRALQMILLMARLRHRP